MAPLSFTHKAREDLLDIWVLIALENPKLADRILDEIESACLPLRDFPQLGRARLEISSDARSLVVSRWLILYRITLQGVQIVRIVDGVRDVAKLEIQV